MKLIKITLSLDPEHLGLLRGLDRKLNYIIERQTHMATPEQITKLTADVEALLAALAAQAPPPSPVADPAIDALDAKVTAATAALTPAPAAPDAPTA